jgi:CDP-ribitol ribitolphosphotransferase / teichoic acid ribitol-phosphate polymerase
MEWKDMMRLKQLLRRIRKYLVKKVTLTALQRNDHTLVFHFHLSNFISLSKKVKVILQTDKKEYEVPFTIRNNHIVASLPESQLNDSDKASLQVFINQELMWITTEDEFSHENLIIEGKYFVLRMNRAIYFYEQFTEYFFSRDKITLTHLDAAYDSLYFQWADDVNARLEEPLEVVAFHNNKLQAMAIEFDEERQLRKVSDFHLFSSGMWSFFIRSKNTVFPLSYTELNHPFDTMNHEVELVLKRGVIHAYFRAHRLKVDSFSITKNANHEFTFQFQANQLQQVQANYFLLINNTSTDEWKEIALTKSANGKFEVTASLEDLNGDLFDKRFFISRKNDEPLLYQFYFTERALERNKFTFPVTFNSQVIMMSFYKRKDLSLGLKLKQPSIQKMITDIDQLKIKGYYGSLDRFMNYKVDLVIEDRNSFESMSVPIQNRFEINLQDLDIIQLKSKDKTILDIYIQLTDKDTGEIIRKEKIKYAKADYKKDNFYGHVVMEDGEQNKHHFLLTTTPFHNIKLESFTIPKSIQIPADTSKKDPKIWLMGERYDTAQDNGIALFNWLRANTDINAYYVMEEDAEDYERVKDIPNVLRFGSPEHFTIAMKAKVLLGTHDLENILPYKPARGFFHYEDTIKIFLQHGVLGRKNVEYHKKFYDLPFDLFIVSSDPEKYAVVMDQLGYDEKEVAVTGLARFDHLESSHRKDEILLMPTWRDWINTDQQFLASEYYAAYSSFINSPKLLELLETYDVKLNFYPHYRAQDFFKKDISHTNDRVNFIQLGTETVQDLLKRHALLITDYSSVSFDFTLMQKPVIYYHFDVKRFFRKGILRPIEETFIGSIVYNEDELLNQLEERLKRDLANYEVDISGIIKYQDKHNCERIYQAVEEKLITKG